jgi:hypothetical protein
VARGYGIVGRWSPGSPLARQFERHIDDHVLLAADQPALAAPGEDLVGGRLVAVGRTLGVQQEARVRLARKGIVPFTGTRPS